MNDTFTLEKTGEEKEIAWLPKSLVVKLKQSQDKGEQEKSILKYIDDSKRDIQSNLESLDDDVIRYKGSMLKARKAFEDAKNEQLDANYKMWEKFEDELPQLSKKIEKVENLINPVKKQIEDLEETLGKINSYKIEEFLNVVDKLNSVLSYDNNTSRILKFLVKEYKK